MVVAKQSNYEEFRLKRVEENKKRMEALNLPKLSQNLNPTSLKTSPMKKRCIPRTPEKQMVIVRRSSRLSNSSSTPVYKEVDLHRVQNRRRGVSKSKRRDLSNRVYVSDKIRDEAIARAEKFQADLGSDYPSFVKSMLQSHVSGGFWLGLPVQFCRSYLGKHDGVITLIDEEGEEYETIHLAKRTGLSGGWMGFAIAHNLAYGDTLVFELVRPTAFKVYIIRVGSSGESSEI
ncbi:PREDICTED: B3 domain-containing protein At5g42700-like isoform X1 [Camelina sativa]|uniref:B3 domain-containing protein At5g42700-like isoform X1 n=1 Tax=Camelina sativa TaxID=90675 RepID=A0ABM0X7Q8_CAMSA|nr:PREDICTED: B3 domain-containing protein At5g42700-like isoform X1 [Camelina sativa]